MGRGDIRTRKGKISAGSFGKRRPHKHHRRSKGAAARTQRAGSTKSVPTRPNA